MRETGLEPASTYVHMNLNHARLPIPPFPQMVPFSGFPRKGLVGRGGFEPPKSVTADLQSAPFGHSGTYPYEVGAGEGNRTRNLLITNQLLCQLSYASMISIGDEHREEKNGDAEGARTLDLQRDRLAF